ncbi:MAG: CHAT domain-containing protein, partial [Cyanobacteria bacterium J06631_2]
MKKIVRLLAMSILGCTLAIVISINFFSAKSQALTPQSIELIQQGADLYEVGQFNQAAQVWNLALSQEKDLLSKSLILSNLSSAYQSLGEWQQAEKTIAQSLEILANLENTTQTYTEISAKALNSQGHLQWLKGNYDRAIATWDLAATNYWQAEDPSNTIKCQLNQIKALQVLGLSSKAAAKSEQVYEILATTDRPELKSAGLQYLGNVLRSVGNLQESATALQESLDIRETAATLLELGNTEKALSDSYLATSQLQLAAQYTEKAISHYQQAFEQENNLQAELNYLNLAIATGNWSDISTLISQLNQAISALPATRSNIYAKLNFARNLSCLREIQESNQLQCVASLRRQQLEQILSANPAQIEIPSSQEITRMIETIIRQAIDPRSKSYALGELGKLYESQGEWQQAKHFTQQALLTLEGIKTPEISYLWSWQLGRILKQQGDRVGAISSYSAALDSLKLVRNDLLVVNSEVQFSFRDHTEPLYRELVDLLLQGDAPQNSSTPPTPEISQAYLEQAIQTIDNLQLAEVENFLNCDLASVSSNVQLSQNIEQIDSETGFLYPIILEDRLEVIFKAPGQAFKHHTTYIQKQKVEQTLRELKTAIVRGYASNAIALSGEVYDWLIKPWSEYLEDSNQISTLVFVLDGELRNIPMGILYDSKRQEYLVQKQYALALLPSFQAFNLQTKATKLKVLGAGISQELQVENKYFSGLEVTAELDNIKNNLSSTILLNNEFTQSNIRQNLEREDFSVVHLATHGNFSSNPEETYILIYNSDLPQGS